MSNRIRRRSVASHHTIHYFIKISPPFSLGILSHLPNFEIDPSIQFQFNSIPYYILFQSNSFPLQFIQSHLHLYLHLHLQIPSTFMADSPLKPPLQRPPGYKDPSASGSSASIPVSKPPAARNKPRLPTSYKPKKRKSSCCRLCCCVFCFLILFLIVVVSLAGALFYLIFDPKLPLFHLLAFRISSFKVAPTPDGSYLDAQVSIRVEFKNPNDKLAIRYGKIEYDVMVGQAAEFGQRELQGFTQARRSTTTVKADSGVKGKMLGVEDSTRLVSKYQSKAMEVKVEARTAVGVVAQGWAVGPISVKLDCESKLKNIEAGDMPTCNINLLRWINIRG
ncbi:NDR1/HIN1-like protein 13 [Cucurbita maxima]|uniref:NDR1/HIN1-like protein 13 n=1 Tax=Cucurbita maxima TaxID=3661 RepID=A0A6J1KTU7_CUCMA|nr:NDR1/HIN1-like protein 13 [Cucurbita maxima]